MMEMREVRIPFRLFGGYDSKINSSSGTHLQADQLGVAVGTLVRAVVVEVDQLPSVHEAVAWDPVPIVHVQSIAVRNRRQVLGNTVRGREAVFLGHLPAWRAGCVRAPR